MFEPPKTCPQAIPTDMGWQDPATMKIIVPIPNLRTKMMEFVRKESQKISVEQSKQTLLVEPVIQPEKPMLLEPAPIEYSETAVLLVEDEPKTKTEKRKKPKVNEG